MKNKKEISLLTSPYLQQHHEWEDEEEASEQSMEGVGLCVLTSAGVVGSILFAIGLFVSILV